MKTELNVFSSNRALVPSSGCDGIVLLAPWGEMGLCLLVAVSSRRLTLEFYL